MSLLKTILNIAVPPPDIGFFDRTDATGASAEEKSLPDCGRPKPGAPQSS